MLIHNPIFTGSISLNGTDISQISTVSTDSSSFALRITNNESTSSAYVVSSGSFSTRATNSENYISALNAKTGSYATTGSNIFNGSQTVSGSLTATSTIIAQTLVVQTVTSSVVYSSGSNIFGLNSGNSHQFTGSVLVSGSISSIGAATVTGNITSLATSGTAAIIAEGSATNGEGLVSIRGKNSSGTSRRADFKYDNADVVRIATASPIGIQFETSDTTRMFIASGGSVGIGTTNPSYQLQVLNTIGLRANSQNFQAIKGTGWGYSPGSYRVVMLGDSDPANFTTVSIGYDPSGNSNGAFNGSGNEVLFRNGASFATPTSANTAFHLNTLVLKDGKIGIGTDSPSEKLHIAGPANNIFLNEATSGNYAINRLKNSTYTVDVGVDSSGLYLDGSGGSTRFYAGSTQTFRIASNSDVYMTNNAALFFGASALTYIGAGNNSMTLAVNNATALSFDSSRNASFTNNVSTNAGNIAVANGNQTSNAACAIIELGNRGYFTTANIGAATIRAISSGGNWYSGTALSFSTNPGPDVTAASAVERMLINSDGRIQTFVNGVNGQFQLHQTNSGYNADAMMYLFNNRNATSSYNFAKFFSGYPDNTQDVEFVFRGDGVGYSDGGWTTPASDYAEYFESTDGTALQIGTTVVLENGKIRQATESDTNIIGAIRPKNASLFLGNNAEHKWNQKYLKDDFGAYILDAEGMRILNPDYDPDVEYIPREKRDEWNIVGLVGQVPILKQQPVNPNWVKMHDVSDSVEMWLIK